MRFRYCDDSMPCIQSIEKLRAHLCGPARAALPTAMKNDPDLETRSVHRILNRATGEKPNHLMRRLSPDIILGLDRGSS